MTKELVKIQEKIYEIRGYQVMLDSDLAEIYQVETRRLNEAVKRHVDRFPSEFMFRLTKEELGNLMSQIATSSLRSQIVISGWGGRRKLPFAFTEHGIIMLSSVLNSKIATQINIAVVNAFIKMRQHVLSHSSTDEKIAELRKLLMLHIDTCDTKFINYDETIQHILQVLDNLTEKPPETKRIGFGT